MAKSFVQYSADGATYSIPFQFISRAHIKVSVDGVVAAYSWISSNQITLSVMPAKGAVVDIRRNTPNDAAVVDYTDGSILAANDLDLNALQSLLLSQEAQDDAEGSLRVSSSGAFDFLTRRAENIGDPLQPQDAANRKWVEGAVADVAGKTTIAFVEKNSTVPSPSQTDFHPLTGAQARSALGMGPSDTIPLGSLKVGSQGGRGGLNIGGAADDESGSGAILASDGLANWTRLQPSKNYNPQEFNVYGTAGQGFASGVKGGNTLTRVMSAGGDPGSPFDQAWVGRLIYWNRNTYRVSSVTDASHLVVTTPTGGVVSFGLTITDRYHYVRTTGQLVVNTTGTKVTRVSGDPFIYFITGTDFLLRINGTAYTVASVQDVNNITLATSAGNLSGALCDYSLNIYDQIASVRVQKSIGLDEENLTFSARAVGEYEIRVGYSGGGKYYPLRVKNGDAGGVPSVVTEFGDTAVTIGGVFGSGVFSVFPGASANRVEVAPAPSTYAPVFRSRGSDTNVGMGWDLQGFDKYTWYANSFGSVYAQLNAVGFVTPNTVTPPSSNASGDKGQWGWDGNYIYICIAPNTWRRIAHSSW